MLYVLNKQAVRLTEKDSTEVRNDPLSLNIWRNLNILRDTLEGGDSLIWFFFSSRTIPILLNTV